MHAPAHNTGTDLEQERRDTHDARTSQSADLQRIQTQRLQENRIELVQRIARFAREDGIVEPLKGIRLVRSSSTRDLLPGLSDPAFNVIAQGRKEIYLGRDRFCYDPYHYCLATLELPVVGRIVEASPDRPYLSFRLCLDPILVGEVIMESGYSSSTYHVNARALDVCPLDIDLLDAVVRLVRLLETPNEAVFLAPLVIREIIYRLLNSNQGDRLRHIAFLRGTVPPIARAIERLRREFDQPIRMEHLARDLGMSISGFYHHFKAVTGMSPLQFQKRLKLYEARRLMLIEDLDATRAAYHVGYNDVSHFIREYKRLFGVSPKRDVKHVQTSVKPNGDQSL